MTPTLNPSGQIDSPETDSQAAPTQNVNSAAALRFGAGFLLHDVSRLRRTVFDQRVRPYGMTRSQWWVLAHLSRSRERAMSQVELARLLDVGKATLGGLIDRLERSGYVERGNDSADRRVKSVTITAEGEKMISIMETIGHEVNASILAGIPREDLRTFERSLFQMKHNLLELMKERDAG